MRAISWNTIVRHVIAVLIVGIGIWTQLHGTTQRSPTLNNKEATSNIETASATQATIVRVIDGDTLIVGTTAKAAQRVRLIGINAPESVVPGQPVECYGVESANVLRTLLAPGTAVHIVTDPSQDTYDKYDRLLGYVYRDTDNLLINKALLEQGAAYEHTYDGRYAYQDEFRTAARMTAVAHRGIWSAGCPNK